MLVWVLIWAIGINWLAFSKGYYRFPKTVDKNPPTVSHLTLFSIFGTYILIAIFLVPFLAKGILVFTNKINPSFTSLPISYLSLIQFVMMVLIFAGLNFIAYRQNPISFKKLWKNNEVKTSSIWFDFGLGAFTWVLAFPIVSILIEFIDTILKSTFNLTDYEQSAVHFVKVAKDSPIAIIAAIFSVLVLAPLIEEFLFRGILQTYLKKRIGRNAAILIAALCFALFHFSFSQGLGNVSLLTALLLLGGYLGFLYERQGSLWAPIGLHVTFNAISAARIIFFPEAST